MAIATDGQTDRDGQRPSCGGTTATAARWRETGRALTGSKLQEPVEVIGEFECRGVAPLRVLLQALEADRLEVARDLRAQARGGHGFLVQHLEHGLQRRLGPERRPPGQHLVEDRARGCRCRLPPDAAAGRLARATADRWRTACSGAM